LAVEIGWKIGQIYICFHTKCSSIWRSSKADREYYTSMFLLDVAQSRPSLGGRTEQLRRVCRTNG
jgi:hypothetical protein